MKECRREACSPDDGESDKITTAVSKPGRVVFLDDIAYTT